jgi:hypothetical protein
MWVKQLRSGLGGRAPQRMVMDKMPNHEGQRAAAELER